MAAFHFWLDRGEVMNEADFIRPQVTVQATAGGTAAVQAANILIAGVEDEAALIGCNEDRTAWMVFLMVDVGWSVKTVGHFSFAGLLEEFSEC